MSKYKMKEKIAPWPSVTVLEADGTKITVGRFGIGDGHIVTIYRGNVPVVVLPERDADTIRKWLNATLDAGVAEMKARE